MVSLCIFGPIIGKAPVSSIKNQQCGHSIKDYSSSIVVVKSHAPVIHPSIPSSLNHPETFAVQDTDDHEDSALSFGNDDSVSPEDLRNSKPLSTQPKLPSV